MVKQGRYDLSALRRLDSFDNPDVKVRTVTLAIVALVVAWLLEDPLFIWWYLAYQVIFWFYYWVLVRSPRRVDLGRFILVGGLGFTAMTSLLSVCLYLYAQPLGQLHYGALILYFAICMNALALRIREPYFYLFDVAAIYITAAGFAGIELYRSGPGLQSALIGFGIFMFCCYHGFMVYEMDRVRRKRDSARDRQIASEHQRTIGQISGGVAHDFNNLLTVVLGNLELSRDMRNEADRNQLLEEAEAAAQRGATLTGQLLAFSRKATLSPAPLTLEALSGELGPLAERMLGRRHRLQIGDVTGLPALYADNATLLAVLLNLILNAKEAMPDGGTIWLDAERAQQGAQDMICLRINDTGTGIEPGLGSQIFEPFFSTKPAGQGSGLGLPMALGFADQSGGEISVNSTPGEGTEVSLWLPVADTPAYAQAAQ